MGEFDRFFRDHLEDKITGSGTQRTADCPFCQHKQDFSFNIETGQCRCFQCGFEGDAFSFLQKLEVPSFQEAKEELVKYGIEPIANTSRKESEHTPLKRSPKKPTKKTRSNIQASMGTFWKNRPEELLKKLEDRGINQRIVARYELGWAEKHPDLGISQLPDSGERLTIPVKKDGKYINIRFHTLSGADNKDLPFKKGLPYATWLFPENQLDNDIIWLCEGELDALCGISHYLASVSV